MAATVLLVPSWPPPRTLTGIFGDDRVFQDRKGLRMEWILPAKGSRILVRAAVATAAPHPRWPCSPALQWAHLVAWPWAQTPPGSGQHRLVPKLPPQLSVTQEHLSGPCSAPSVPLNHRVLARIECSEAGSRTALSRRAEHRGHSPHHLRKVSPALTPGACRSM